MALGVKVIGQVTGVNSWIGGELLLVQTLDGLQGVFCRIAVPFVAVNLEGCQVIELWRCFRRLLLADMVYDKWLAEDSVQGLFSLGPVLEGPVRRLECRAAIDGLQHPVWLRMKRGDLLLPADQQGQGGCLHTADGQQRVPPPIAEGIQARGVHPQQPVSLCPGNTGVE